MNNVNMSTPRGKNIVVYDEEIVNEIGKDGVTWGTYDKMGISVGVTYSFLTGDYDVYLPTLEDGASVRLLEHLNEAQMVVGFNVLGFDNRLLIANTDHEQLVQDHKTLNDLSYDLLRESRLSMGWRPGKRYPRSMTLDHHLEAMFGKHFLKTESAGEAPALWKGGQIGRVIAYCISDVRREANVFEKMWKTGKFVTELHGSCSVCRPPQAWGTPDWDGSLDWQKGE